MAVRRVVTLLVAAGAAAVAVLGFFYFRDNFFTHYPIKAISAAIYRAGEIPWWNFHDGGGQPLAGNPNTLTFYPDNVLYLLLPAHVAFNLHFLIHLVLAWFAMRALCLATGASRIGANFAATMYATSGLAISALAFYNLVTAIALIPFALWTVERERSPLTVAAAFGLIGLAGEPVIVISTGIAVLIACWRKWKRIAVAVAISALAFYNLVTAIALIPFALWTVERERSPLTVAAAFGLIGLAGEPVVVISAGIAVLIACWHRWKRIAVAVAISVAIVSPQLIAYGEIAGEVERSVRFSANATLAASLWPRRIAEIAIGPILGFLTDPGHDEFRSRLFSTLFLGIVVVPALAAARKFRYVAIAAVMLFLALGRFNPVVTAIVDAIPSARVARYPEKFAIALTVALAVLVAAYIDRVTPGWRAVWIAVTFVPLAYVVIRGTPVDWFAQYAPASLPPQRVCVREPVLSRTLPARAQYREFAETMPPIFGAASGLRYAANPSPEGMHSLMSRIVYERLVATGRVQYLRICGCEGVPGALPMAWFVPRVVPIRSVNEEVQLVESGRFDERTAALAPSKYASLVSPPGARVTRYAEGLQEITISVSTPADALLFVNQSFFRAWSARSGGRELSTLPLDIDRLGVIVPAGEQTIVLRFGRHRAAVAAGWIVSSLLLVAALGVEIRDRRAGQVQRSGDENRPRP